MPYVYILRCHDGSYYVGSTARTPEQREWEHNNVDELSAHHTRKRRPVYLVYTEVFDRLDSAAHREKQLHGWSRAKKEALIAGRVEELQTLSRPRGGPSTGSGAGVGG
ncbi:MAG: GIY-YIG nuclease family protein [Microbacterium sp.]|uniref:GIY-YIG nuclease family protein n=1 Tax=Microbacterium sp. TaxID=51671 RepID=UPI0039E32BBE